MRDMAELDGQRQSVRCIDEGFRFASPKPTDVAQ
jgi:hypothetical protein